MARLDSTAIVIPAYQPSELLIELVQALTNLPYDYHLIIVNDGSTGDSQRIFAQLETYPKLTILNHSVNLGKGQALKTAFAYYVKHFSDQSPGLVTADADGQHRPEDIQKIMMKLHPSKKELLLGTRQFDNKTPLRSRFGNILSAKVFKLLMRKPLQDTQSGLRGVPRSLVSSLLDVPGTGYEYELGMLIYATKNKIAITEVPIKTIYLDNNKSSHFNPIVDSVKIYFVFLRYILGALSSAAVDFLFFSLIYFFSHHLFASIITSRIISGTFNFTLCKRLVFKSKKAFIPELVKYISLALFSVLLSYVLIKLLTKNEMLNVYYGKIIADFCIFIMNFIIQRVFIFSLKEKTR